MKVTNITGEVKDGDGVTVYARYAEVVVELDNGERVTFVIHQSRLYQNTINVEIDGDLMQDDPSLRVHLNDNLVWDSTRNDPAIDDLGGRKPDFDDEESTGISDEALADGHRYVMGNVNAYCPRCSELASEREGRPITVLDCEFDTDK